MDATRCISYLTIEKRGEIPSELREGIGRQVFGCDICQDVCPWNSGGGNTGGENKGAGNRRAPTSADPELATRPQLVNPALDWLASFDEQAFGTWFFGSPVKRTRFAGFRRNLAIAMGNSRLERFRPTLESWTHSDDPVLAESAAWALGKLDRQAVTPETRAASSP